MTEPTPDSPVRVLVAPADAAAELAAVVDGIDELGVEALPAPLVESRDGPLAIGDLLAGFEHQATEIGPQAALVGGAGDEALAAVISLVKLGIPVAHVHGASSTGSSDLPGLLADHEISSGEKAPAQVAAWLRRILPGR